MKSARIAVLYGGVSLEREVSLASGRAVADALAENYDVDGFLLDNTEIPERLDGSRYVVFPALHGAFGEDGNIQHRLEERNIAYAGSGPEASRLCFDKIETKKRMSAVGVRVVPDRSGTRDSLPAASEIVALLGCDLVLKPARQGSSVGLHFVSSESELIAELKNLGPGEWLIEKRIHGREITVGILEGRTLGLVEIIPRHGRYDYRHKYTTGMTDYRFPAEVRPELEAEIRNHAELTFRLCGCRDFARVDFMVSESGESFLLEINTLPGLTSTSLLPKSAACFGFDFVSLARRLVEPAVARARRADHNRM